MKPRTEPKDVTIYTDGSCQGNPGPGGYGVVLLYKTRRKELAGGYRFTTNNRMELMAAVVALRALKTSCHVVLRSDSAYLVNSMIGRLPERWARNGWRSSDKKPVLNRDLWEKLVASCARHQVRFVRVRGHAGEPENERCDRLAADAARQSDLAVDWDYEREE
ncbi:MAG: ribonuclease HI [Gemmatimonadales bacterium]